MKFINFFLIIFISFIISIKANSNEELVEKLKEGKKIIFIRHAYAPGSGDPKHFDINNCLTQRNLNEEGRNQAKMIGLFFSKNNIPVGHIISSEWCRCKETASIAFFGKFRTNSFLNSFYEERFYHNKTAQIKELRRFIKNWDGKNNLVLVTHYVLISEILNFYPSSGEIVISDKDYNVLGNIKIHT